MKKQHVRKPFLFAGALAAVVAMVLFSFSMAETPNGLDYDMDGIYDQEDNCMEVYNPMQMDRDGNGVGDVCDGEWDGQATIITYPKKDEFVLCYYPYSEPPEVCETITVEGNVKMIAYSQGSVVAYNVYTEQDERLTGTSDMFGEVEVYLSGMGGYQEEFEGMDFPANTSLEFSEWSIWVDKQILCDREMLDQNDCEVAFPSELWPDNKVPLWADETKVEWGTIKAFPPLYENPLCTRMPNTEGGFMPITFTPEAAEWPQESGIYGLMFNCDEFGTPVLNTPATANIAAYLGQGYTEFEDLNTDVEVRINKGQDIDEYVLSGKSTIGYYPTTEWQTGHDYEVILSGLEDLDLIGVSPLQVQRVGEENAEVRVRLLTPEDEAWQYKREPNPYLQAESYNPGIEFYLLDIVEYFYNHYMGDVMFPIEFYSEIFPMVGVFEAYIAFDADLDGDGDVDTIVPLEYSHDHPDPPHEVQPVILGAYPGKKGVPPYYTTYCTLPNSYILQLLKSELGWLFDDYIPEGYELYRVMRNGEMTQPHYSGILDSLCFEVRENEKCDGLDNDYDGLVDEGPYNWLGDDYRILKTWDFEDEMYGDDDDDDDDDDDTAIHTFASQNPPQWGPNLQNEQEFWTGTGICEQGVDRTFYIEAKTENGWEEVGNKSYEHYFEDGQFNLDGYLPDADGEYKVKIRHDGEYNAHIDAVSLGGKAPMGEEALAAVDKVLKTVKGEEFIVEFATTDDLTLILTAREESKQSLEVNEPMLIPGVGDNYYTHTLGENSRFIAHLFPTSGHEAGPVYTTVSNDDVNLYINVDVTEDNTNDQDADFIEILIGEKTYKVTDSDNTFGELSFKGTKNAAYPHKVADIQIPLKEVENGDSIDFKVNVYGTLAGAPQYYCQIAYSDGQDDMPPYDFRYWAQNDDAQINYHNTHRFIFNIGENYNEEDLYRFHWEGRALLGEIADTAFVYVWNTAMDDWEFIESHDNIDDDVIETTITAEDHVFDGREMNFIVLGDLIEEEPPFEEGECEEFCAQECEDNQECYSGCVAELCDGWEPQMQSEVLFTDYVKLELIEEMEGCERERDRGDDDDDDDDDIADDDDDDDDDDGGSGSAAELQESAPEAAPACLDWHPERKVRYARNGGWPKPYIDLLSKLYVIESDEHIISGDKWDPTDEKYTSIADFRAADPALRYEALGIALRSFCFEPYANMDEMEAGAKDDFNFADAPRDGSNPDVPEYVLYMIYKAYDLGLFDGRVDATTGEINSDWNVPIYRVEALALFMRLADMEGLITKYADITIEELEKMVKENWVDVDVNEWYAKYIPFVIETKLVAENDTQEAFPYEPLTRGEDTALALRMIYITSVIDHINQHTGHTLLNEFIHGVIQSELDGAERSEFLFGEFLVGLAEMANELV